MTQAQYKNQIEQSDSLINIAYSYFTKHDNAQRKALALYYKGILRHESHHAEDALSFYLEAATEIEKTNDYQLGFLINSEVGLMYLYRKLMIMLWNILKKHIIMPNYPTTKHT